MVNEVTEKGFLLKTRANYNNVFHPYGIVILGCAQGYRFYSLQLAKMKKYIPHILLSLKRLV